MSAAGAALALLLLALAPLLAMAQPSLPAVAPHMENEAAGDAWPGSDGRDRPQAAVPAGRPAAQGSDLDIVKSVQTDTDPASGGTVQNGDHITYTIRIRNRTGGAITIDRVTDELTEGTLFGVACANGTPGTHCQLETRPLTVSTPSVDKGSQGSNTVSVISITKAVIWSNFTIAGNAEAILRFTATVDCQPAGATIGNDAGVAYGGGSFLESNSTSTVVQLKPTVTNASGKPLVTGPSGCSAEAGAYDQDWGDFDQDGDLDLALGTSNQTSVYKNNDGQLVLLASHSHQTLGVRWVDVDGDGQLELVSVGDFTTTPAGLRQGVNYIYDNGVFFNPAQTFTTPDVLWRVEAADYDKDGRLDLAAASYIDPSARAKHNLCLLRLYKNNGSGGFTAQECLIGPLTKDSVWVPAETRRSYSVAWADINKDGKPELGVGDRGTHNRAHANTGGLLSAASSPIENTGQSPQNTTSLAWLDFDDDGDPDPAWGNDGQASRLYRNDGAALPGTWTLAWTGPVRSTRSVAWNVSQDIPNLDASIPMGDDDAREYPLPFVFPFGQGTPRNIIKISVNTNGMIELLEAGETCRACGSWLNTHASNIHRSQNIDAIFAGSADLYTGVLIESLPEDAPNRVEVTWMGTTYGDGINNGFEARPMLFKVILHASGNVDWKIFNYNYAGIYGDRFAGIYDEVANVELPINLAGGSIPSGTSQQAFNFTGWGGGAILGGAGAWSPSDRSIPMSDNADLGGSYALPFGTPMPFYTRSITRLCINTNGLVELLEATDSCREGGNPYTHRDGRHISNGIDAIFAANDDLRTGVLVEGDASRVSITWMGTSNFDYFYSSSYAGREMAFKVILFPDGRVWWKFFDMNFTTFYSGSDYFSGTYGVGGAPDEGPDAVPGGTPFGYNIYRRFQFLQSLPSNRIRPIARQVFLALGNYGQANELYEVSGGTLVGPSWNSNDSRNTTSLAWVDLDGDGDTDLTAGDVGQEVVLYRATGPSLDGDLTNVTPQTDPVRSIAWADLDADGDPDLAVGNEGAPSRVYRNNGDLPLELAWSTAAADSTQSVAWADVDADGFPDLAVGNNDTNNKLYHNVGGTLDPDPWWTSLEISQTRQVAWGDVDGDGDLDLAVANDNQRNALYLNRRFFLVGAERRDLGSVNDLAWGDYNKDGFPDLAIGGVDLESPGGGFVYVLKNNNGNLLFTRSNAIQVDQGVEKELFDLAWGDYNRDGYLDLVGTYPGQEEIRFYRNENGSGAWTIPQVLNGVAAYAVDWVDLQRDGWLDLAVADSPGGGAKPRLIVYLNRGDGAGGANFSFTDSIQPDTDLGEGVIFSLRGIDRDNDGDLDLSAANLGRQSQQFTAYGSFLNPRLADSGNRVGNFNANSVAWGDYDGDGRQDLLFGGAGIATRLYRNKGTSFCLADGSDPVNCPKGPSFDTGGRRVALFGDFDGDNKLDVADGVPGGQVKLFRSGSATAQSINNVEANALAWGDGDGDGRLDLLIGGKEFAARQSYLYFNQRTPPFLDGNSVRWALSLVQATVSLAWADYDNDTFLDFVAGNCSGPGAGSLQLYHNNGDNTFSPATGRLPASTACTRSVAWADYDGDGDPDLAVGNDGAPSLVYRNPGAAGGAFSQVWSSGSSANTRSVAWGDWNNDGTPELALGNYGQADRVYGNFSTPAVTRLLWLWTSSQAYQTTGLAWGDKDGDGDLDLAFSQDDPAQPNGIYENGYVSPTHLGDRYASLPRTPTYLRIFRPGTSDAYLISSPALTRSKIAIDYTLYDAAGDPIVTNPAPAGYKFEYSLNNGLNWRTATLSGTLSQDGSTLPGGRAAAATWDAATDGVANDEVRLRLTIVNNKPAGPIQYATTRAVSPPFRLRSLTCEWPADPIITSTVGGVATNTLATKQTALFLGGFGAGTGRLTFRWDFGNGGMAVGQDKIPYSYTVPGIYTVSLAIVGEPCPITREVRATTLITVGLVGGLLPTNTVYLPLVLQSSGPGTTGMMFDPNVPVPSQVEDFRGRMQPGQTRLDWAANPPDDHVLAYRVYRSSRTGPVDFQVLAQVPAGETTYTDTSAACGYMYYVKAMNAGGESLPSTYSYISRPCD